jgi:hypothetical protein
MTDSGIALLDVSRRADGTVAVGSRRNAPPRPAHGGDPRQGERRRVE